MVEGISVLPNQILPRWNIDSTENFYGLVGPLHP